MLGHEFFGKNIVDIAIMVVIFFFGGERISLSLWRKTMTYEEFMKLVDEAGVYYTGTKGAEKLSCSWSLGGSSGNCYGPEMTYYDAEQPEELDSLDLLLEKVIPTITFLQYKNLVRKVVTYREDSHSDYYGGHSSTAYKECSLRTLFNELTERGFLSDKNSTTSFCLKDSTIPSLPSTIPYISVYRVFKSGEMAKNPIVTYENMTMEMAQHIFGRSYATSYPENYNWQFKIGQLL